MQRHVQVVVVLFGLVFCTSQHLAAVRAPSDTLESRALRFVDRGRQDAARAWNNWKLRTEPWVDRITTLTKERLSKTDDQIKLLSAKVKKQVQAAMATDAARAWNNWKLRTEPWVDKITTLTKERLSKTDDQIKLLSAKVKKQVQAAMATGDEQSSQASPDAQEQPPSSWSWWRIVRAIVAIWLLLKVLDYRAGRRRARAASSRHVEDPAKADDDESGKADAHVERRRRSARARLSPMAQFYLSSGIGASPFDRRRSPVSSSTRSSTVQGGTTREAEEASNAKKKDRASNVRPVVSKGLRGKPAVDDRPVAISKLFKSGVNHSEVKSSLFQKAAQAETLVEPAKKEASSIRTPNESRPASAGASSRGSSGKSVRSLSDFSFLDEETAQDCLYASSFTFHRTNTSYTSSSTVYVDEDYAKLLARR